MVKTAIGVLAAVLLIGSVSLPARAQAARWGSPDEPTVKAMIAKEKMWADSACSPQPGLVDVFAAEFQGTATDGHRYGKAEAAATDVNALDKDCQFGEVKVQFFGADVAIAYGTESRLHTGKDGKAAKRCMVWTDTWLRRSGKWEIVSAQDTIVPCE